MKRNKKAVSYTFGEVNPGSGITQMKTQWDVQFYFRPIVK